MRYTTSSGGIQGYLPHKNGKVVAGCFGLESNPEAPDVVLVGSGPQTVRWARVLCDQEHPIPVFIKRQPSQWEYVGEYSVDGCSEHSVDLAEYGRKAGRANITRVLFLTRG